MGGGDGGRVACCWYSGAVAVPDTQLFLLTAAFFSLGSRASAPVQCWDIPYF